jgi:competence protein ComEA
MVSAAEPTENTPDERDERTVATPNSPTAAPPRLPLLRRADQMIVALLVALSLVAVAAYWALRGGAGGELIEIESDAPAVDTPRLTANYTVDINSADWPEFEPLPGVGERLARRIVESRETDGPFASVDDLDRVSGIGEKTVERLRPFLRADPPQQGTPRQETP